MKKFFLIFNLIFMVSLSGIAQIQSDPQKQEVELSVKPIDPVIISKPIKRSPAMAPSVSLSDHTLYFNTSCDGYVLRLVNEDGDIEYDIIIPEDTETLSLPFYLEGEYELQIIRDNYCFYGYIEL
ncbi:DUF3244 domain-containing protein [Prevotella sp. E15-22]|uniref:DUF3244 domain-containing protein n=1 Tax=Prevotella sp. E15-22 TaxID=2937774 RepID=UPI00206B1FF4|nr:DUF3244 domain-containing protein [Prevotella sp. E15-22]UPS44914.1 DUF3244 domain-containing protein [Prevotella sp. E15-22]